MYVAISLCNVSYLGAELVLSLFLSADEIFVS